MTFVKAWDNKSTAPVFSKMEYADCWRLNDGVPVPIAIYEL
jgi:hypothetical protein